ncbi:MAG: hypothetical protein UT50_C0019G0001 [Candidatus Moranbacteria bacterium GW2011_GWA2_39_41]|nr:MAG: hypothetical protein UT50_C0019G0001 [Candidatus Moranbacteria bacterium GW2011_GWA2_39_41]
MKIKILKYVLVGLALLFSFLAWQSVDRAINIAESSVWGVPIFLFSALFILVYLSIALIRRMMILQLMLLAIFLFNFIFAFSFSNIVTMTIAYLLSIWSMTKIKNDLHLNVKINLWKSIRTGSALMLLAFSLMITSQYYTEIKNMSSARIIPHFNIGEMTGGLTSKLLSAMNSDFKNLDQDGMTIDQFILQIQKNQSQDADTRDDINTQVDQMIEAAGQNLTIAQKRAMREDALNKMNSASMGMKDAQNQMIVQEGRKKFSEMAGVSLVGDEKVSTVLSNIINHKINQYLGSGLADSQQSSPLIFIMAIGLFLTVLPIGSLLNTLWIIIIEFIIWILIKSETIVIAKIPVEMEIIEQD